MTLSVDLYWSCRSPYSYIALQGLIGLAREWDFGIAVRVVHPGLLRNPDYIRVMNPVARRYFMLDSARAAAYRGLPFHRPRPDPVVQDPVTLTPAADHPLARRLGRLCVAAAERGQGLAFCDALSRLLWDGSVEGWDQGDHLARVAAGAGLDLAEMEAAIAAEPDRHEAVLGAHDAALRAAGHWGVPTMVYDGEPFFGQDRIGTLLWRMRQHGLARR
jgi:2-hydroxychromene-2-carboxylate isomerase